MGSDPAREAGSPSKKKGGRELAMKPERRVEGTATGPGTPPAVPELILPQKEDPCPSGFWPPE